MEIWKDVVGYEGLYQVSNLGNVKRLSVNKLNGRFFSICKEKILKDKKNKYGYVNITLTNDGNVKTFLSHRLVAIAFIPNLKNKPCVNHINGIKYDNRVENLEWVTAKENTKHAYDTGLQKSVKGELHCQSILTEKKVLEIRASNLKQKDLAVIYNVGYKLISQIKLRKTWKHI
jgi:hypothetical protein